MIFCVDISDGCFSYLIPTKLYFLLTLTSTTFLSFFSHPLPCFNSSIEKDANQWTLTLTLYLFSGSYLVYSRRTIQQAHHRIRNNYHLPHFPYAFPYFHVSLASQTNQGQIIIQISFNSFFTRFLGLVSVRGKFQ